MVAAQTATTPETSEFRSGVMKCIDRQGNLLTREDTQDKLLNFLYKTKTGRKIVFILIKPWLSRAVGAFMDSKCSRVVIKPFLKRSCINMEEYENRRFSSFDDFFTRKIRDGARPADMEPSHLISPCDCRLSVYPITQDAAFRIKGVDYTMESLLRNKLLAQQFEGGTLLLLRLTVDDYHRYSYVDNGIKGENTHIAGVYHTVNPVACEQNAVYRENSREYSVLESENFGRILMMEVGAMLIGRIVNYHAAQKVCRGQEKGRFEFGGSTVILCLQEGAAVIDSDLIENTGRGIETVVKLGEKIGVSNIADASAGSRKRKMFH